MKRAPFSVPVLCLLAFLLCALCVSSPLPSAISLFASPSDPVARPKIYSIAFVRLKATDFAKSTAFYATILGLKPGFDDCKGISAPCFAINPYQHVELLQTSSHAGGSFLEVVGFNVSDVAQMKKFLAAKGIAATEITRGSNGLRFIEASDPEGNRLAFVELSGGDAQIDGPRQISNRMLHAGFVVRDLDLMKKFYLDLLGFRLYWYGGFKDDGTDWYEIQVPDGDNWVEFMLNISPTADHQELGVQNHFSLGVTSANTSASKLRENGATKFDGPEVGRDGKNAIDIYDPDLSRVEVMDFTPTKAPCCHPYTAGHPKP
jgi:catechol 2,3-dioxygenase-like lactoylglutathione lyase family enzyme